MSEIQLNLPDLGTMSQDKLLEECNKWRSTFPHILGQLNMLMKFRSFADNPEELQKKIDDMKNNYQGTIELKERHISELEEMIQYLKSDPLGIDRRFKKPTRTKPH